MSPTFLSGLAILLGCTPLLPADSGGRPPAGSPTLAVPPTSFSAASARVEGGELILTDLRPAEANGSGVAGRELIDGDDLAQLGLWALRVGAAMRRATPFLGEEKPAGSFLKSGIGSSGPDFVAFRDPVYIKLTDLDSDGSPHRSREVSVRRIRLAGERP